MVAGIEERRRVEGRSQGLIHNYAEVPARMYLGGQRLLTADDYRQEDSWKPSEPETSATLWRYMSLAKFCSLLDREALFFPLVGDMEDKYEGFVYPPKPREHSDPLQQAERLVHQVLREIARTSLISCWTESDHESSLMWKAYAGAEGIAVRTSFQNLRESIHSVVELPVTFGQVEYVHYPTKEVPRFGWAPLLHKRMEYREEGEVRAILPGPPWEDFIQQGEQKFSITLDPDVAEQRGRYIPVDLEILVQEIVLPPYVTPWFAQVVRSVVNGSPISSPVTPSSIESPPI